MVSNLSGQKTIQAPGGPRPGDAITAVGLPHMGGEVKHGEKERTIAYTRDVRTLLNLRCVHEIIPVGSQGILHEARTIARDSNLRFTSRRRLELDVCKSAGPATVALCACRQSCINALSRLTEKPVTLIGTLN